MAENNDHRTQLLLILAAGLTLRLLTLGIETYELRSDSLTYHKLAVSMLSGEYSIDGRPTAFVVPGYPVFLAGIYSMFGEGQFAVRIIQSILDVITCFLFYLVCRNFFDDRYSVAGTAVFTFFPSNILYTQAVLTESLFGLAAMALLYFLLKAKRGNLFFTGVLFGIALLIRSSLAVSAVMIILYIILYRKELFGKSSFTSPAVGIVLFAAGIVLVLSPWIARNKIVMGESVLATQGGSTLWEGNNPMATGTWNKQMVDANPLMDDPDEIKRERELRRQAVDFILSNPVKFAELGIRKLAYLFSSERMILLYFQPEQPGMTSTQIYRNINPAIITLINIPYFAVMLLGTWGLLLPLKKKFIPAGFVAAWMATMFVFVALPRYHYVLIPFFIIGVINVLKSGSGFLTALGLKGKIAGAAFTLFLLGTWAAEFYLLYFKED